MPNLSDALTDLFYYAYKDFISGNQIFLTKNNSIPSKRCIEERINDLLIIFDDMYSKYICDSVALYGGNRDALLFEMTEAGNDKDSILSHCSIQAYNAEKAIEESSLKDHIFFKKIILAVFSLEQLINSYVTLANHLEPAALRNECWLIYQTCKEHSWDIDIFLHTFDRCIMNNGLFFGNFFPQKFNAYRSGLIPDLPDNLPEENNSDDENDDDSSTCTTISSLNSHLVLFTPTTQKNTSTTLCYDCKNNR